MHFCSPAASTVEPAARTASIRIVSAIASNQVVTKVTSKQPLYSRMMKPGTTARGDGEMFIDDSSRLEWTA